MYHDAMHGSVQPDTSALRGGQSPHELEEAYQLVGHDVPEGMRLLFQTLKHLRDTLPQQDWSRFCRNTCRAHPLHNLVQQDPATRRCFLKPRHYAGDAVLLDLFYKEQDPVTLGSSELGWEIHRFLSRQQTAVSLRRRRDLLAHWLDELAEQTPGAHVLSVACGHLREALLSRAVRERRLGEFLALDQDSESLEVVDKEAGPYGVTSMCGTVRALLKGELRVTGLDGIYAAGLYDYLPRRVATQLTRILFSMLKPGGRLLLANYGDPLPDSDFKAYMEAFMDWWLIYRDEAEVEQWTQEIPQKDLYRCQVSRREQGNLIFLEAIHA
ncbi:MAG TPA: class I SAM-dependent methyltransferase [Myxococcaceae bacterium]|nr:class I SAM-dependent methyltransferase [Myxococcaceae bacterium]